MKIQFQYYLLLLIVLKVMAYGANPVDGIWQSKNIKRSVLYIYDNRFFLEYKIVKVHIDGLHGSSDIGFNDIISGNIILRKNKPLLKLVEIDWKEIYKSVDGSNNPFSLIFDSLENNEYSFHIKEDTLSLFDIKDTLRFYKVHMKADSSFVINHRCFKNGPELWQELTGIKPTDDEILKKHFPYLSDISIAYCTKQGFNYMRPLKGHWIQSKFTVPSLGNGTIISAESKDMRYVLYQSGNKLFFANQKIMSISSWNVNEINFGFEKYPKIKYSNGDERTPDIKLSPQSIVIDKNGTVHIAFIINYSNVSKPNWLVYGKLINNIWEFTNVVETDGTEGKHINRDYCLEINKEDNIHIVYTIYEKIIKHLWNTGNKWYKKRIPSKNKISLGATISLKIDDKSNFHILFYPCSRESKELFYIFSNNKGKTWKTEKITDNAWWEICFQLDNNNTPLAAFMEIKNGRGKPFIAKRVDKKWIVKKFSDECCVRPNFIIDDNNRIHLTYYTHPCQSGYFSQNRFKYYIISKFETLNENTLILDKPRVKVIASSSMPMIFHKSTK